MGILLEYVKRMPGHRNSKGESAPWVIVSHKTGKVLSSHKTKAEAEEHLKQMHIFKERRGYHNRGRVLEEATYYYVSVPNEEEEHEFHSALEAKRFMMAHEGSVGQMVRVRANGEWEPVGEIKLRGRNSYKMSNRDSYRYESRQRRGRMLKESSWPMEPEDLNDLCSEKADEIVAKRNGIITDKRGIFLDAYLEKHHPELELEREWTYERLLEIVDDDGYFHRRDLARLEAELDKEFPLQG